MDLIHQRYRQTDGRTTCDRNTALCTKVHRAVNNFPNPKYFTYLIGLTIKPTDSGLDSLPYLFLKLAAPSFAPPVVAHLFGLSLQQSVVPSRWKISCIIPVPYAASELSTVQADLCYTNFIQADGKKTVLRKCLYPVLCDKSLSPSFSDQFSLLLDLQALLPLR